MTTEAERVFPRRVDRELVTNPRYDVADWRTGLLITYLTVELTIGYDGYRQLAEDADLGRRVTGWRARNPQLAELLDAELALDALEA